VTRLRGLQDFDLVDVGSGSFTTEAGKAKGRSTSASPQKRTNGKPSRRVRFVPQELRLRRHRRTRPTGSGRRRAARLFRADV